MSRSACRRMVRVGTMLGMLGALVCSAAATYAATVVQERVKLTPSDGSSGDLFGYSVAVDGDTALAGAYTDDDACPTLPDYCNSGSAYVFVRSGATWRAEAKLVANDTALGDYFGVSVAVFGDTALVGAPRDDDHCSFDCNSGSAYVFVRIGDAWVQQAKLTARDASPFDFFGGSVALGRNTALVGSEDADGRIGAVYVFVRIRGRWFQQVRLTASDGAIGDAFGNSVSLSGDTALVGAYGDADLGSYSGSAYVFVRSGLAWVEQAKLNARDGAASDFFGWSVSVNGDTALVGASGDDDGGSASGSAYVFERSGGTWMEKAKLTASDGAEHDDFGHSVAMDGDTALVGAHHDDDACPTLFPNPCDSGSAYVFARPAAGWASKTEDAKLAASDGNSEDLFGFSVALSGGIALVGADAHDALGTNSGAVYVFSRAPAFGSLPGRGRSGQYSGVERSHSWGDRPVHGRRPVRLH